MAYSSRLPQLSPGQTILFSLFITICIGTFLLALPASRTTSISFIDLFFTSCSATCVTGLFTIALDSFTIFGKCVLLALIQIGGIGLITMTLFFMSLFWEFGLATQVMAGQLFEIESWKNVRHLIIFFTIVTLSFEFLGAIIFFPIMTNYFTVDKALFFSLFHAISSFCNAGISIFPAGIQQFEHDYFFLSITMLLMFIGGLGFITWHELMKYLQALRRGKKYRFSLHSKIVLYGSCALIIFSTLIIFALEQNHAFAAFSIPHKIITSLFYGFSLRSTGFSLINSAHLQQATIFFMMLIAFIGTAPGSTGSGVKITTFTIFLATIKAVITGRSSVEIRGRTIPRDQIFKSMAIMSLSIGLILFIIFCLLIFEKNWRFMSVFFETMAAFTNLGMTTGLTTHLSFKGKLCIIASMIIGRIGSLTLVVALKFKRKTEKAEFSYPEERIMLG